MAEGLGQQNSRKDNQVILNREADTKALLDENTNVSSAHGMLHYHGWNAGILSIGTFGLLKDDLGIMIKNGEHKEYFGFIDKDGQDRGEKWEEGQEAEEYCRQDEDEWEDDNMMSTIDVEDYQDSDVEGEWNPLLYASISGGGTGGGAPRRNAICAITINPAAAADHNINVNGAINIDDSLQYYDEVNKKKERITLADLFSAESEDDEDDDDDDEDDGDAITAKHNCRKVPAPKSKYSINKKPTVITCDGAQKNGLAVVKKVIPKAKEDGSRPMQKLQGVSGFLLFSFGYLELLKLFYN